MESRRSQTGDSVKLPGGREMQQVCLRILKSLVMSDDSEQFEISEECYVSVELLLTLFESSHCSVRWVVVFVGEAIKVLVVHQSKQKCNIQRYDSTLTSNHCMYLLFSVKESSFSCLYNCISHLFFFYQNMHVCMHISIHVLSYFHYH